MEQNLRDGQLGGGGSSNPPTPRLRACKYLGVILHEHVDFGVAAEVLAGAVGRALGSILHKYKQIKGLGYYTYSKLYQSCVCPVLDYAGKSVDIRAMIKSTIYKIEQ